MRFALFFFLYGLIQLYFAAKAVNGLGLTGMGRWAVYAWALAMAFSPLFVWRVESCAQCHAVAVGAAWVVYAWMGFSLLFICLGMLLDIHGIIARLAHLPRMSASTALALLTLVASGLWVWGFYSAWNPRVEHLTLRSGKLPVEADGLRIVQVSDVHLGVLIGRQRLTRLLDTVAAARPDILVSTGDLVDAQAHHLDGLSSQFAAFKPRFGKFAVTGNHESYVGLKHAIEFHERSGFTMLHGAVVEVAGLVLAGVDDPAVLGGAVGEAKFLNPIAPDRFVVLLKHQPRIDPAARFDLQLSGHTHAGQIFPFRYLVSLVYPMNEGLYPLGNGGQLYVSRGTGTWGPPIRVFARPEITVIELKRD